jgi:hypothetical protein
VPVAETLFITTAKGVASYVGSQGALKAHNALKGKPGQRAFSRALGRAVESLEEQQPEWTPVLMRANAFKEGHDVLAQFLIRNGNPNSLRLTEQWITALPPRLVEEQGLLIRSRELEAVATDFLEILAHELQAESELEGLFDSRTMERIAGDVAAIRRRFRADEATPGTHRDYLRWLIERNLYLDPRGIVQTQRQVQVKLEDVYISLRAQTEKVSNHSDSRLLERELRDLETMATHSGLSIVEIEDRREQILLKVNGGMPAEVLELAQAVNRYDRLVILGDPGSGKSTLLRYLALMHAQALRDGKAQSEGERGDRERAAALYEEALAMHRELGNRRGADRALGRLSAIR